MAWHDTVFNGLYDLFTFHLFTPARNSHEAGFIVNALGLEPGMKVLDTACGYGRHALLLAEEGIRVTGIDKTRRYIEMAKKECRWLEAEFYPADYRNIDIQNKFDAAYNFFTSFGYHDDHTNLDSLRRFAASLKPGGKFLLDLQNRELYSTGEPWYEEHSEFERDGIKYALLLESELDVQTSRVEISQKLYGHPDGPLEMCFSVRLYTMAELRWLFHQAGMEVIETFGDVNSDEYSMTSSRCIVVGQKN